MSRSPRPRSWSPTRTSPRPESLAGTRRAVSTSCRVDVTQAASQITEALSALRIAVQGVSHAERRRGSAAVRRGPRLSPSSGPGGEDPEKAAGRSRWHPARDGRILRHWGPGGRRWRDPDMTVTGRFCSFAGLAREVCHRMIIGHTLRSRPTSARAGSVSRLVIESASTSSRPAPPFLGRGPAVEASPSLTKV